jgi:PKD repeat protein/nitrous oxidase accessory protein NosD
MVTATSLCAGSDPEDRAEPRAYTAHDPIKIVGNDDLTAANGVTGGTGTKENPYVISGWEITAASGHGMEVLETHGNYLTIRDCKVKSAPSGYAGMRTDFFESIASIEHCVFEGNDIGMLFSNSQGITIHNCTFTGNRIGVKPGSDSSVKVQDCTFSGGTTAVHCAGTSDRNEMRRNTITAGTTGIVFEGNLGGTVTGNTFPGTPTAISITTDSKKVDIFENEFQGQTVGISIANASADIRRNRFSELPTAIKVVSANVHFGDRGMAIANKFIGGTVGLSFEGGNYWDLYNNSFENVPSGIRMSADTQDVLIDYNDFRGGTTAIEMTGCKNNNAYNNNFTGASSYAVSLKESHYNKIYQNNFQGNNAGNSQAFCDRSDNKWNLSVKDEEYANWWNGLKSAKGNYWSDMSRPDSDRDGFVDGQYAVAGGMTSDTRPLSTIPAECGEYDRLYSFCFIDVDKAGGPAPFTVDFKGMALGSLYPFSYSWDFGDGGTGTGFSASHTYPNAGTFTATLTVTARDGMVSKATKTITPGAAPVALEASASADKTGGAAPLAVSFTGSATGGTSPYTYAWDFGDGSTGTGASAGHAYNTAGTYSALLTVMDSASQTKKAAAISITVTSGGGGTALSASATADKTSGAAPLSVLFTGTASGGSSPYTFSWSFGDGSTGSGSPASHSYNADGVYDVILTVTDSKAATKTAAVITVTVGAGGGGAQMTVAASASPTSGPAPLNVQLSAAASGGTGPYTYEWNFGDGTNGTGATLTHKFQSKGTYNVLVTVKDSAGHQRASTVTVEVKEKPQTIKPQPGFEALAVAVSLTAGLLLLARKRR